MKEKNRKSKDRIFTIFLLLGLSFTVFSQTDPTVVATAPAANALGVDNAATIGLTFSETMDAATLTADNIKITGSYGPPLGFPAIGANAATAVLGPDRDFFPGEVITATLTTDVASSAGNPLASSFTYRFTAGVSPNGSGEFPNGQNIIGQAIFSSNRSDVTVADLDGDGDLDVLSASDGFGVTWFENNGSGSFGGNQGIVGGTISESVTTGDLDGDGDLDILSIEDLGSAVRVDLNDGSENFIHGGTINTGAITDRVKDLTIGDLDGDGDLDALSTSNDKIVWYPNDGIYYQGLQGPFIFGAEKTITTAADIVESVTTGDLDGDGDLDVLSASAGDNRIAWYPNDGNGNFGAQLTITTAATGASEVAVADLDGDGDLDVLSASAGDNRIAWYPNDGNGNFGAQLTITTATAGARDMTVADMDGDGDLDVLSAFADENKIAWYQNDGNGNFGDQLTINAEVSNRSLAVATGDLDGDGDLDVLSAHNNSSLVAWYENTGSSSLTVVATDPAANALDADNAATMGLTFNETIDATTLTMDNIKISGNYGRPLGFPAPSANAATAVLDPDRNFFPGEVVTATLTTGVTSSTGNLLASPFTYRFTAGVSPNSPGEFPNGQNIIYDFVRGANRNDVTVADLDGDGDLDVIANRELGNSGAWFPNDGSGNLGEARIIQSGLNSFRRIIPADLDGDGDLEVLAVTTADSQIDWYLNDGSENFTDGMPISFNTVNVVKDLAIGDLDGDGDLDMLLASFNKITWYPNDGLTTDGVSPPSIFGTERTITTATAGASGVATGDLDGDGDLDVVSSSAEDNKIAWYPNDGSGNFGAQRTITQAEAGAEDVIVADLDGDGNLDVISTSADDNRIAWYRNDGNGNFGNQQTITTAVDGIRDVTVADLDGDGDLDVLSATFNDNRVAWYPNDGNGNFGDQQTIATAAGLGNGYTAIATGDLDGDGDLDVFSARATRASIAWYENAGSSLTVTATDPAANALGIDNATTLGLTFNQTIDAATLTTDNIKISGNYGRPLGFPAPSANAATAVLGPDRDFFPGEVITATLTTDVAGSAGNPLAGPFTYQFTAGVSPDSPGEFPNEQNIIFEGPRASPKNDVTVADLDGDGDLDVIASLAPRESVSGVWYENDGSGNLGDPRSIDSGMQSFRRITTADLDGDGNLEVLAATTFDAQIAWYLNDGNENFTEGNPITFGLGLDDRVKDFTIGDLDGDGDLDVLSASSNKIAWYPNDGLTFDASRNPLIFGTERTITLTAAGASGVAVADLDGDGDLDALSASANDNRIAWYPNDGIGNFGAQQTITMAAAGAQDVIVADLDGDGDLDVISTSADDNRIAWYPNDGNGNFGGQRTITTAVDGIRDVTVADLDGDGDLDVLSATFDDDRIAWYPNDGNGNFGDRQTIITAGSGDGYTAVATGDLDGDGDLDVLSARSNNGGIAWYENAGATTLTANCTDPFTVQLDANGTASIVAADIDDGSIGATSMDIDITDLDCSDLGENTVTLTVTDASGGTDSCTTTVTVEDSMAPIADMAVLPDVRDECGATVTVMPTATDNCAGTVTATTDDPLEYPEQGTYTVTWTYDDGNGNTSTQEQTVIVESSITSATPDMAILPNVIGECSATVTTVPTATADCGGTVTATTDDPLEYDRAGTFTITWTYNTGNGNTSTQEQTVIVEDSMAPVADMAILPDVIGGCGATVTMVPTATDDCAGTVTATTNDPLAYPEQGTYTVTWTYDDGNGNTSTQEQTVIAESSIAPPIPDMASLPDVRGECSATVTAVPTATDNCAGTVIATTNDPLEYDEQGTFTITWTYSTGNGNTSTQTQTVVVEDTIPPIAIVRDITVGLDENGRATIAAEDIDNGSTDNCGIAELSLDTAVFDCPELGDTNVELTVTDVSGNSSSATATVTFTAPDNDSDGTADVCGPEISIIPGQGVSPNGDGIHDTWTIGNIADHPEAVVKVFDRNGREVFGTDGYRNDWGGTEGNGGKLLPVGSYYYIVHLQRPTARNVTGWLYLNY